MAILIGWSSCPVDLVLTNEEVWAMVDRARRFDVAAGGRYDLRGGRTIMVWAGQPSAAEARPQPVAAISIRWRTPDPRHATIWQLAWDARRGVPESEAWTALEVLLGRAVR